MVKRIFCIVFVVALLSFSASAAVTVPSTLSAQATSTYYDFHFPIYLFANSTVTLYSADGFSIKTMYSSSVTCIIRSGHPTFTSSTVSNSSIVFPANDSALCCPEYVIGVPLYNQTSLNNGDPNDVIYPYGLRYLSGSSNISGALRSGKFYISQSQMDAAIQRGEYEVLTTPWDSVPEPTEPETEQPTEPATEPVTEPLTEPVTELPSEPVSIPDKPTISVDATDYKTAVIVLLSAIFGSVIVISGGVWRKR